MFHRHGMVVIVCFAVFGVTQLVHAADASVTVENSGCVACHAMNETRIGPPYTAIAARYVGSNDQVIELLAQKVLRGGAGNWGVVPMIPHGSLDSQKALVLVRWILRQGSD